MLEVTAPQRWFDLTVGLTEGWWAFSDAGLRPDYPTLSRERWLALLKDSGFDEIAALPEGGGQSGALALQSLFLAKKSSAGSARDWLVFADSAGMLESVAARLRARGDRCTLVKSGTAFAFHGDHAVIDASRTADYEKLFDACAGAGRVVFGAVHGFALDLSKSSSPADSMRVTASALELVKAVIAGPAAARLWFVTRGAAQTGLVEPALEPLQAPLSGFARAVRRERPELHAAWLDVDPEAVGVDRIVAELDGSEPEVALRGSGRRVPRLGRTRLGRTARAEGPPRFGLTPATPGSLEAFTRVPLATRPLGDHDVEVAVEATGMNFKDVLNALGMYPGDPGPLGGECAGTVVAAGKAVHHVKPGDAVFAVASGCLSSHVVARSELVQPRPPGVSAEEGAAFPIAFLTAEFCLGHLAKIQRGDRVLIHAAAGGVGMAAVQIAQRVGAEVYATAGSEWKRELLRALGVRHVFDSRSTEFAAEVEAVTAGAGVTVVLNSLSGEFIDASFRVLARGGRFVEIGKRGIKEPAWVTALGRDIDYHVVDRGETAEREPR